MQMVSKKCFILTVVALVLAAPTAFAEDGNSAQQGLSILEAETASEVEDRETVGATDSFSQGDEINAWMKVQNPNGSTTLEIAWKVDGNELHTFDLDVDDSWGWRTWAQMTASQAGDWEVDIRDDDGDVLETLSFTVSE